MLFYIKSDVLIQEESDVKYGVLLDPTALGNRLRQLRGTKTQQEFADLLGISRTYLGVLETGAQAPSRNVLNTLHARLGISANWILYGTGEPYDVPPSQRAPLDEDRILSGMLGVDAPRPRPTPKETMTLHDSGRADKLRRTEERVREDDAMWNVKRRAEQHVPDKPGAFGYLAIKDKDKVRMRALTEDPEIDGTQLQLIAKNSELWNRVGGVSGWEFEELRIYFAKTGDRPYRSFLDILHFIRVRTGQPVPDKNRGK